MEARAGLEERQPVEVAQELDVVAPLSAGSAPVGALAIALGRPDMEAVRPAAGRARPLPFAAGGRGGLPKLDALLGQVKGVHAIKIRLQLTEQKPAALAGPNQPSNQTTSRSHLFHIFPS